MDVERARLPLVLGLCLLLIILVSSLSHGDYTFDRFVNEFSGSWHFSTGHFGEDLILTKEGSFIHEEWTDLGYEGGWDGPFYYEGGRLLVDHHSYMPRANRSIEWSPKVLIPFRWGDQRFLAFEFAVEYLCDDLAELQGKEQIEWGDAALFVREYKGKYPQHGNPTKLDSTKLC
jgi:hypothetical protein